MTDEATLRARCQDLADQAHTSLEDAFANNLSAARRISQTGQPYDDNDRLLIRKAFLTILGDVFIGE